MIRQYEGLEALPLSLSLYGASDYATMIPKAGKREPDFTEHGVAGVCSRGELWFVDWWSGQTETDVGIRNWSKLVARHKPMKWWNEGGLIDKAIGPSIRASMLRTRAFTSVIELPLLQDKAIKLQAFHAMCTAGIVHFPLGVKWADEVIDQLVRFPGGRWDDKADVCGLIGRGVDEMHDARVPSVDAKPLIVPFTESWLTAREFPDKPKVRYF